MKAKIILWKGQVHKKGNKSLIKKKMNWQLQNNRPRRRLPIRWEYQKIRDINKMGLIDREYHKEKGIKKNH